MHKLLLLICVSCISLSACDSGQNSQPAPKDQSASTPQQAPSQVTQAQPVPAPEPEPEPEPEPSLRTAGAVSTTVGDDTKSTDDILKLASKSGCLACHKIEKKVVGPAWQDVAAKYKGDPTAKSTLIEKVKKGGKGNWTEITGGTPMPPYSPRVSDDNIERLVSFVLSLDES